VIPCLSEKVIISVHPENNKPLAATLDAHIRALRRTLPRHALIETRRLRLDALSPEQAGAIRCRAEGIWNNTELSRPKQGYSPYPEPFPPLEEFVNAICRLADGVPQPMDKVTLYTAWQTLQSAQSASSTREQLRAATYEYAIIETLSKSLQLGRGPA
jgi:hypothetical protein